MTVADGLRTADSARPRKASRARRGEPQAYDFRRPSKLSRDHIRALQMAMETFARQWSTLFTTTLRAVTSVSLESVQQVTYDEYVSGMPAQTTLVVLEIEPLEGRAIMQLNLETSMVALDHLLGGPGRLPQPARAFTDIESSLIGQLMDRALHELRYALAPLLEAQPRMVSIEHNPQFVQAAASSDMMLVSSFALKVGASEGIATLALPFTGVFPYLEAATRNRSGTPDPELRRGAAQLLRERVQDLAVEVTVGFGTTDADVETLLSLTPGDVLTLSHPTQQPLAITAAGVTFAHAVPGSEGKRLACRVVATPQESQS